MTMLITLTPMRHDTDLTVQCKGDVLIVNDQPCDLAKAETCDWIVGLPEKVDGVWQVTLILPHGANAPEETLFPEPVLVKSNGPVPLPPHDAPEGAGAAPKDI